MFDEVQNPNNIDNKHHGNSNAQLPKNNKNSFHKLNNEQRSDVSKYPKNYPIKSRNLYLDFELHQT